MCITGGGVAIVHVHVRVWTLAALASTLFWQLLSVCQLSLSPTHYSISYHCSCYSHVTRVDMYAWQCPVGAQPLPLYGTWSEKWHLSCKVNWVVFKQLLFIFERLSMTVESVIVSV